MILKLISWRIKRPHKIIGSIALGLILFLFLPLSPERYLESFEETVQLGTYDIKFYIPLKERGSQMLINGEAEYPRDKLKADGCFLDITLSVDAYETQNYTVSASKYRFEHLYCDRDDLTLDHEFCSKDRAVFMGSSNLGLNSFMTSNTMYLKSNLIQLKPLTYKLSLKPKTDQVEAKCDATAEFTHDINYYRISWFEKLL